MTSARMDVSVVVCSFTEERWAELSTAIASIRSQGKLLAEIILVVDHNEPLFERACESFPDVRVMKNSGERGLSDARNTGVSAARGDIVAFIDDDAVAGSAWLRELVKHYDRPAVIGVGGFVAPVWPAERPAWFPEEFDWIVGCSYRGLPTRVSTVRNLLGCNMSFRRSSFERAGGFDARIGRVGKRPVGCEETEFCIRLARLLPGSELVYDPAARVDHHISQVRARWRYFVARSYSEGLSKAIVSRLAGAQVGLQSERAYVIRTLVPAIGRTFRDAVTRRSPKALLQCLVIPAGLGLTAAGFVVGSILIRARPADRRHR
jgi:GT2 family glycosyltransferase